MENMNFNNINNNENEIEPKISDELNRDLDKEDTDGDGIDTDISNENIIKPEANESLYEDSMLLHESFDQKEGYTNAQNKPVKRNIFKKMAPYIACMLVSAIVGGAASGAYLSYAMDRDNQYTSTSVSQGGGANPLSYSQPDNLVSKIAEEVGPSVAGVDTQTVSQNFFEQQQAAQSSGSGIIFDKNGYIVTNQHVIDGSKSITVTLPGGKTLPAQVVGQDPTTDIAVIKVNANNLPAAKLGDSSKARVGDLAVAIGNPMGEEFAGSVTSGIISALNRSITMDDGGYTRMYKLIQTDAAINPGNSGGALINENGEVIGINSIKFATDNVEGMGFAIPINDVKTIINQLMSHGYVSHPFLGVSVENVTEDMAQQYNCPAGVGVDSVAAGSAAEAAGIQSGDIILKLDDAKLTTGDELSTNLAKHKAGDSVKLTVWRNGSTITIPVTLGENKGATN